MQQTISLVSNSYSTGTPVLIDILIYTDCELLEPPFSLNKTCAIISLIKGMQVAKCWILDICSAVSYFTFSAYEVKKNLSLFWIIQSNFFWLFTHTSHLLYWSKSFHCSRSLKRWCVLFPNIDTFIYHKMCPQILQSLTTGQKQYVKLGLILWPY